MERITWSGIALRGGPLPGYAASHGCVRMPYGFAERLFDENFRSACASSSRRTMRNRSSFPIRRLFVPNAEALADAPVRAETLAREAANAAETADEAKSAATLAARAAASLAASLRRLEALKTSADAALAFAERLLATTRTDQAKARAEDLKQKAAAKATALATQLETAQADTKTKLDAAKEAQDAAKVAETKKADTAKAAHGAKLALEPVSIFISRATQRLYVRRGFGSNLEVAVTIRNPDKPIGRHVFTAVARTDDGPALDCCYDRQRRQR